MTRPYITYNGKTSSSFGLTVTKIERPAPQKRLVRTEIPYSNYTPDFSRITGRYIYKRRVLKYQFACEASTETLLAALLESVEEWLSEAPSGDLTESLNTDFYYADCTCDSLDVVYISPTAAKITASFTAYPYRRSAATQEQSFSVVPTMTAFTYTLSGTKPLRPFFTSTASERIYFKYSDTVYLIPPNVTRYQLTPVVFVPGSNSFQARTTVSPTTLKVECINEVI